ncbi:MAG: hypothetical protein ACPLZY_04250 [Candidatus Norongarragalinales archaeon]
MSIDEKREFTVKPLAAPPKVPLLTFLAPLIAGVALTIISARK